MSPQTQHLGLTLSDLNNDVLLEICDHLDEGERCHHMRNRRKSIPTPLKNLSSVNRRFRALLRPRLMRSIAVEMPFWELSWNEQPSPNGGEIARNAIAEMMVDEDLTRSIKELRVNLYGRVSVDDVAFAKRSRHIINFLRRLTNLQLLSLDWPYDYMLSLESQTTLKAECEEDPFVWKDLTTICLDYGMTFLLEHSPKLERLALYDSGNTETPISQLSLPLSKVSPYITHLEARANWTPAEVVYLAATFPFITHLAVHLYFTDSTEGLLKVLHKTTAL
ncbi:hypothetical protein DM02DRAFT_617457 [Periconia macrospinosa]|uniref:F-box domain-containing protein n=1 Tax=Periconia macrospinosa TaxID=97972 RepID=A0A2V1DG14_9PLEO|nr:hypothetical protein DM02DRAFT_617457 [Periconia macrospinosa]